MIIFVYLHVESIDEWAAGKSHLFFTHYHYSPTYKFIWQLLIKNPAAHFSSLTFSLSF